VRRKSPYAKSGVWGTRPLSLLGPASNEIAPESFRAGSSGEPPSEVGFFEELAQCIRLTRYRESFYAMIVSAMDETSDAPASGLFVVGGIMGRGVALFELERKWNKHLKRPDIDIAYFRAVECKNGRGEFAKFVAVPGSPSPTEHQELDEISHEFLSLIPKEEYILAHGIGVLQKDFYEVIKDTNARAILGNSPYRLAYDLAMVQCAWTMRQLEENIKRSKEKLMTIGPSYREHVCFVCDEDEEHSPLANEAYRNLKLTNPNAAQYMAAFSSADDKENPVLQAADAVVFEIRRVLNLVLGNYSRGALRKQFNTLADPRKMFLITHTNREQLLHIVANHKPGEPFKLDELMNLQPTENIRFNI
jgi:hypothetical protein